MACNRAPVDPGAGERGDASYEQHVAQAANLEGQFSTGRPELRQAARNCESTVKSRTFNARVFESIHAIRQHPTVIGLN